MPEWMPGTVEIYVFFPNFKSEDVLRWKRYAYTVKRSEYWGYNNNCMGWCQKFFSRDEEETHRQCIYYDDIRYA